MFFSTVCHPRRAVLQDLWSEEDEKNTELPKQLCWPAKRMTTQGEEGWSEGRGEGKKGERRFCNGSMLTEPSIGTQITKNFVTFSHLRKEKHMYRVTEA